MVSVKDFGARGDGQTDDTESIQHAVTHGDGHLIFPRGVYRISRPIEVNLAREGRTSFSGDLGVGTLAMHGPGPAIRLVGTHDGSADPQSFDPAVWAGQRLPTLSGLEIVGEHSQAIGVEARGTMQLTIQGVLIRQCVVGVRLTGRNRNVLIANSHIYHGRGPAIGVHFDSVNLHQAIVSGCHISYHAQAGIKVDRSEVRNLQITGNDIEYNHDPAQENCADVWIDAREGTVREGTIASNTIQAKQSPGGSNVRIDGPDRADSAGAGLWTIVGNILQSQEVNLRLTSCRGVTVTDNSFASGYGASLLIDRGRVIGVTGNTFDHNPDYGGDRIDGIQIRKSAGCVLSGLILEGIRAGSESEGGAIAIESSREISVVGCQILDPRYRGIDLRDVSNTQIHDCIVLDRADSTTFQQAVRFREAGPGNSVSNCRLPVGPQGLVVEPEGAVSAQGLVLG